MGAIQQSINNVLGSAAIGAGIVNHTMQANVEAAQAGVEQKIDQIPEQVKQQEEINKAKIGKAEEKVAAAKEPYEGAEEFMDMFEKNDRNIIKANRQLEKAKVAGQKALDSIEARKAQLESFRKRLELMKGGSIIDKAKANAEAKEYIEGGNR